MKPVIEEWTVVLAGSWNVAILNPEWVGRELLNLPEVEMELVFGAIRPQLKVSSPLVSIIPQGNQVIFNSRQRSAEAFAGVEAAATALLEKLPITPITAMGINFGYTEEAVSVNIANLFAIGDTARISDVPLRIKSTTITRQLEYDGRDLNFRMTHTPERLMLHFNYHLAVTSAEAAKAALAGKVATYQNHSQQLLKDLYNLEEMEPAP